ncbi:MAG: hypothetical protein ACJASN_003123, partial [Cyclobacteriaceae bacterium]
MKKLIVLSLTAFMAFTIQAKGPDYASEATKEIIQKMIL